MSGGPGKAPDVRRGRIRVLRSARYFALGRLSDDTEQAWFVCHGYGQSAERFVRRFASAAAEGAFVVAPEGLSRFYVDPAPGAHRADSRVGASWMTRVDREAEIRDYVAYLDALARHALDRPGGDAARARPKIVALGFSQGGHAAARWAALGGTPVDALALWGSHLPPEPGIARRLAGSAVVSVFGDRDPVADADAERREDQRFAEAGVVARRRRFAGGHEIDPGVVRDLARSFAPRRRAQADQNSPTNPISGSSS